MKGRVALSRAVLKLSDFIEYPTDVAWMASPFYRNLTCDIRLSASRNVWIRDRELNVEISGDLDLVKDRKGLRVYGSLDSRHGRYEFQNRSFAIDRGEINFRGKYGNQPRSLHYSHTQGQGIRRKRADQRGCGRDVSEPADIAGERPPGP